MGRDEDGTEVMAAGSLTAAATVATPAILERGATFGRYVVLERLGGGGMGVVYSAYDPELDRKIAVKILRPEVVRDQSRLRREAQAMARLQHPNVIAVYDVGMLQEQAFVAMELVDGQTLSQWLQEHPSTVGQVLELFVQAGRGLAAAHAVGLVHRDFKPANVLLGRDGRVRVGDFGLARAVNDAPAGVEAGQDGTALASQSPVLHQTLTGTGALIGTPTYMSPEQLLGRPVDAKSDQFSFCVALYGALYGERPFVGDDFKAIADEVTAGRIKPPPRDSRVPGWLRAVVVRGLAAAPEQRWPTIDSLLAVLQRDPAKRRQRWLLAGGTLLALSALAVGYRGVERQSSRACRGAERKLVGVWDPARKQAVHAAFRATKRPFAEAAFAAVTRTLDAYAQEWAALHTEACEATHVRHEQSEELLDLRMECLSRGLQDANAQIDLFTSADEKVVSRAVQMTSSLPSLRDCSDVAALRQPVRPPTDPKTRARVGELRQRLARATALLNAGKYKEGLTIGTAVVAEAQALAYRPLEARALDRLGRLQRFNGDFKTAESTLEQATLAACAGRDAIQEIASWTSLVWVAESQGRYEQAHSWARRGFAILEGLQRDDPLRRADLLEAVGTVLADQGKYPEALDHQRRALAIRQKVLGAEHSRVANSFEAIARVLGNLGRYEESKQNVRQALAIFEKLDGPDHPDFASSLFNLAYVLGQEGHYDEALADYRRNLAIWEKALGPEHPRLGLTLNNIGSLLGSQNKWDEALPYLRRSLAISEKSRGREHPDVALALGNIGEALRHQGQYEAAIDHCQRAVAMFEKAYGPSHPLLAATLTVLGNTHLDRHQAIQALPPLTQALAILEKQPQEDPTSISETRFALGRALWDSGRDHARAHSLVAQARTGYATSGIKSKKELAAVEDWLAKHS